MDSKEIRQKFLRFFEERGHKVVPSSSLVPTDPSVLLTTAGMQQFKPYYSGQKDPLKDFGSKNTASIQKSFRTSDIEEVGDESHLTFFEMLGNFSFGGYFKNEAIQYGFDFITKEMDLVIDYVSVFEGDSEVPADTESEEIWKVLGVNNVRRFGRKDNFWGPTGSEGPCGPTTEIYINGVEVWNIVFNQYYMKPDKTLEPLVQNGVDTGMGLERLAMMAQKKKNIFETDLFESSMSRLSELSDGIEERKKRIISDHIRSLAFLIADGVRPSNKETGYVLRRLLRRSIACGVGSDVLRELLSDVADSYGNFYKELDIGTILEVFDKENSQFSESLNKGLKELEKLSSIDAVSSFRLYESYGLPYEVIKDRAGEKAKDLTREDFDREFKKHQEISRAGAEKKFGGHGIVEGDLTASNMEELKIKTRLHTATHLLNSALRKVLGDQVSQRGSDITTERARFDFVFERKMTDEEIKKVEDLVNKAISKKLPVTMEELPTEEAKKSGAVFFYKGNYGDKVKVYSIGDPSADSTQVFSREICGGPHVSNTSEIGRFRIVKEESSSAGVRRIRAITE